MKFELNPKTLGSLLVAFSLILLFILILVKVNVDTEQGFLCKFVEESPELDMEECPAHESKTSWLLLAGFGMSFLVLASGLYLIFAYRPGKALAMAEPERKEVDLSTLSEEEKKVYDLLMLKEGSMYQSDLIRETALSKVKVSRILDRMEGKGLLDRKRRGMTNIVVLK